MNDMDRDPGNEGVVKSVVLMLLATIGVFGCDQRSHEDVSQPGPSGPTIGKEIHSFSDATLREYPDIRNDLSSGDTQKKYDILLRIVTKTDRWAADVGDDIACIVRLIADENFKGLGPEEKRTILEICGSPRKTGISGFQRRALHLSSVVRFFVPLMNDPDFQVREGAIEVVRDVGGARYAKDIAILLADKDQRIRGSAIHAIGVLRANDYASDVAVFVNDAEPFLRATAIDSLGLMRATRYTDEIAKHLNDEDGNVRLAVIRTLGQLKARKYVKDLIPFLESDCQTTMHALGELGVAEAGPAIVRFLGENESREIHILAMTVLGMIKASACAPPIVPFLKNNDSQIHAVAATTLGKMGAKEYAKDVFALIADPNSDVSQNAIFALARMKAVEYADEIAKLMTSNQHPCINLWAVSALGRMRAKGYAEEISRLLTSDDYSMRCSAVQALGIMGARQYVRDIQALLNDDNVNVRQYAAIALVELGAKSSVPQQYFEGVRTNANTHLMWSDDLDHERAERLLKEIGVSQEEIDRLKLFR